MVGLVWREDSPCDITRGLFAGEIGSPRLLKLFDHYGLRTTWFIPGHSIETFPRQMQMVADAGHEIGLHGYSHENPVAMTPEQEEAVLNKCIDLIERFAGRRPDRVRGPWWELSAATVALLLKNGITYDHSRMDNDFHPFYARVGDTWTKIDYSQSAETWMKPLVRGEETDLVEIGANWYVDDLPPMMFIKKAPNSHGFVNPRHLEEIWRDQFDWVYREYDYAVFPITIHPDVSGRPAGAAHAGAPHRLHHRARGGALGDVRGDRRRFPGALPPLRHGPPGERDRAVGRPARPPTDALMCVLCGALWTEQHWAEVAADERSEAPDGTVALEIHVDRRGQRLRDRARRAQLISAVFAGYGLHYQDWEGSSYIVRDAKGNTAIARTWPPSCPRPSRFSALPSTRWRRRSSTACGPARGGVDRWSRTAIDGNGDRPRSDPDSRRLRLPREWQDDVAEEPPARSGGR